MLSYRNKTFTLNDEPFFLYGAECHYFRVDPAQWDDRLRKIREAGFNTVSTYIPWIWHEPHEGETDFTGATHPRRNLVGFLERVAEAGLLCVVRPGPYVMSELKNEGIPEWVIRDYPGSIATDRAGKRHPARVMSYSDPTYLALARRWYGAVLPVLARFVAPRGGPIVMVQLDNEVGMLHWVTGVADESPSALAQFDSFGEHDDPSGMVPVAAGVGDQAAARPSAAPPERVERSGTGVSADRAADLGPDRHWRRAGRLRAYYAEYVRALAAMADEYDLQVPYILNIHGFKDFSVYSRGVDYPIGLSQLAQAAGLPRVVVAGDFYPGKITYDNFHDLVLATLLTDAISDGEQPIFSAEFQSGRLADRPHVNERDLDLITRLCIAHGMSALNYYMYCGGDNPGGIGLFGDRHDWQAPIAPDGSLRAGYAVTEHIGRLLQFAGRRLCATPLVSDTTIGFYRPYYATECADRSDPEVARMHAHIETQREHNHFDGMWRLLVGANISFQAVDLRRGADLSPATRPSLWVASTEYMDADTQASLADYAEAGGVLVLGPQIPDKDLGGRECRILADRLQLGNWRERQGYLRVRMVDEAHDVFTHQHLEFADVPQDWRLAVTESDPEATVIWMRPCKAGKVMVLGCALTHEFAYNADVMAKLAAHAGVHPHLRLDHPLVHATERRHADGSLLSLINVEDSAQVVHVTRGGVDAFGGHAVQAPARSGLLLPLDWRVDERLTVRYATVEIVDVRRGGDGSNAGDGDVRAALRPGDDVVHVSDRSSGGARYELKWLPAGGEAHIGLAGQWRVDSPGAVTGREADGTVVTVRVDGGEKAEQILLLREI